MDADPKGGFVSLRVCSAFVTLLGRSLAQMPNFANTDGVPKSLGYPLIQRFEMTEKSLPAGFASLHNKTPLFVDSETESSQYRIAFEIAGCPLLVLSLDDLTAITVNDAAAKFFRLAKDERFCLMDYVLERDLMSVRSLHADLQSGEAEEGLIFVSEGDGVGIQRIKLRRIGDKIVAAALAVKQCDGTASLDNLDPLTGLMNRRVLKQRLQRAVDRTDKNWGVLFIDLNDYKRVNDLYGHIEGDRVLVEFARKLAASVRPADLVSRFGGDEFVVLVERIPSAAELRFVANRIAAEVSVAVEGPGDPIVVTASIGCAVASNLLKTGSDMIAAADRDMYKAKSNRTKS